MTRTYRIADDVAWVSREDLDRGDTPSAYVARLPVGPLVTLDGPACLVWLALEDGGTLDELADAVADLTSATPSEIAPDVAVMLDELVASGLATAE